MANSGGEPEYRRQSTAVVLTPAGVFCHKACCQRCGVLICAFILLAIVGTLLALVSPLLGGIVLTLGPSALIIAFYYYRYAASVSRPQVFYTFCEAICWMLPLFVAIHYVDMWNNQLTARQFELTCSWEVDLGGKAFVNALSFAAHCNSSFLEDIKGDWDGANCTFAPFGFGNETLSLPNSDGELDASVLDKLEEVATNQSNGTRCPGLEIHLKDAVEDVSISSLAWGSSRAEGGSKKNLAKAFDALFAPDVLKTKGGAPLDCACVKSNYTTVLPQYDYCGPDGTCLLEDSCNAAGDTGYCAEVSQENVTVTFKMLQKTVLHAFITAYFRAGFLEELLKYVAVRRILYKDLVADTGGLIVYGLAAAAGFATAENAQYTLLAGIAATYGRMILSVPLHCCTGLMIGIHLGYRKFLGRGYLCKEGSNPLVICSLALFMPVFIHGTYDVVLMLPARFEEYPQPLRVLCAFIIMLLGFVYARCMWLKMDNVCVVHVKDLIAENRISQPRCCCCDCRDCGLCQQSDPALAKVNRGAAPKEEEEGKVIGFMKSASNAILPEAPKCQTEESSCPNCGEEVRINIVYPSDCPYCGYQNPDPADDGHQP